MNLPNKIIIGRIVISLLIIALLLFPLDSSGLALPKLFINESIVVDLKYVLSGFLFMIAILIDYLYSYIARKKNMITDFERLLDTIADNILVNSVLVILSASGFISPIIPVVIIIRDCVVNSIKMMVGNKEKVVTTIKSGKVKTACLITGIALTLFYNLPFELWNFRVSDALLIIAAVLSVVSAVQYYYMNREILLNQKNEVLEN